MREDLRPVVPGIPANLGRGVDLDGHHLGGTAALNDDDERPNAPVLTASFLAALNVGENKWIPDVCPRNYMGRGNGEPGVME